MREPNGLEGKELREKTGPETSVVSLFSGTPELKPKAHHNGNEPLLQALDRRKISIEQSIELLSTENLCTQEQRKVLIQKCATENYGKTLLQASNLLTQNESEFLISLLLTTGKSSAFVDNPINVSEPLKAQIVNTLLNEERYKDLMSFLHNSAKELFSKACAELKNQDKFPVILSNFLYFQDFITTEDTVQGIINSSNNQDFFESATFVELLPRLNLTPEFIANLQKHFEEHELVIPLLSYVDTIFKTFDRDKIETLLLSCGNADTIIRFAHLLPQSAHTEAIIQISKLDQNRSFGTLLRTKFKAFDRNKLGKYFFDTNNFEAILQNEQLTEMFDTNELVSACINAGKSELVFSHEKLWSSNFDVLELVKSIPKNQLATPDGKRKLLKMCEQVPRDVLATTFLEIGLCSFVLENDSLFATVDSQTVIDSCFLHNQIELTLLHAKKLQVDSDLNFITKVIDAEAIAAVFKYLHKLNINHQWLFDQLISKGHAVEVAKGLGKLNVSQLNKETVKVEMVKNNLGYIFLYLPQYGSTLSNEQLAQLSVENDKAGIEDTIFFVQYLTTQEKMQFFSKHITKHKNLLLSNFQLFQELPQELLKEAYNDLSVTERTEQLSSFIKFENYQAALMFIEHEAIELHDPQNEFKLLTDKIKYHLEQRNLDTILDLCSLGTLLFPDKTNYFNSIMHQATEGKKMSSGTVEERKFFEKMNCQREILLYYVSVVLQKKYKGLLETNTHFVEIVYKPVADLFDKMRDYTITAVKSELNNSKNRFKATSLSIPHHRIYLDGSEESLRLFFSRSRNEFLNEEAYPPLESHGGKPWAEIAKYSGKLWENTIAQNKSDQVFVLNILISLQHNGGLLYDKNAQRVDLDEENLKEILDFEAAANRSLIEFLDYGIEHGYLSQAEYSYFINLDTSLNAQQDQYTYQISSNKLLSLQTQHQEMKTNNLLGNISHLPLEIQIYLKDVYEKKDGFTRESSSPVLLGRLLNTSRINWQNTGENSSEYTNGENKVIMVDIEGFKCAFWYKNDILQSINDRRELRKKLPELSRSLGVSFIAAQIAYTLEGD